MSFFRLLQREKEDIHDLTKRVEEFVESAGKVYEQVKAYHDEHKALREGAEGIAIDGKSSEWKVLNTSLALKLRAGASLKEEITRKIGMEKNKTTAILLEQLSMAVSKELSNLNQVRVNLMELWTAQEANQVIAKEEALRKLKAGMDRYKKGDGTE